ncbi:MAG TPA: MarR family transcriptional regulator [Trebonia sp.]|jgi:DNA-binding MarR family transcriptional regulator
MEARGGPARVEPPADDETIAMIEVALHSLARRLKQARLHEYIARQAGDGLDQAGLAILYALQGEEGMRVTDVAARLGIDAPAVTRKAQHLERLNLVSRARDAADARASRLQLTPEGCRVVRQFLLARHEWLTTLLAGWSPAERCEFARLLGMLSASVNEHLNELCR